MVAAQAGEKSCGGAARRQAKGARSGRWTLGVGVAMWACGFFVARVPGATRPEYAGASALFVVAFALPSYAALWLWVGKRRAWQVLVALGAFAMGIESLAVATGWPYGQFSYGDAIGGKVAGLVPWTVPFAWTPLVLGTHALAERLLPGAGTRARNGIIQAGPQVLGALAGTLALAIADLVLDPGAVRQKFWAYNSGGAYYGVPASNYFGWILSGLCGHAMLRFLLRPAISKARPKHSASSSTAPNAAASPSVTHRPRARDRAGLPPAGLAVSLSWTLAFWASVCAWAGLWAPAAIGHAFLAALWLLLREPKLPPRPEPKPEPGDVA